MSSPLAPIAVRTSAASVGSRKCEAFIMTGDMIIRTSPQRPANKSRSKSASGSGNTANVSPAHRSNSADPNTSTVEDGSPLATRLSGPAEEEITRQKEVSFAALRDDVPLGSVRDSEEMEETDSALSSPSSPPPLPPLLSHELGAIVVPDQDSRHQTETREDTITDDVHAKDETMSVEEESVEAVGSEEEEAVKLQERHIPTFIPLDEENWVASNKFRRLPPEALPPPEETPSAGTTLPAGDLSLCFSEPYGETPVETAGQVELAFRSPIKDVDRASAARLASRLFHLTGFKRSDVARHLGKSNDFSQLVTGEYVALFRFEGLTLDAALRTFLSRFCLTGESQERERVLQRFAKRYMENNPNKFKSEDACHALTCAIMLLNTDHHGQSICRKMTLNEFSDNLQGMNDGGNFPKDILKHIFNSIKNEKIEWAVDDTEVASRKRNGAADLEGVGDSASGGATSAGVSSNAVMTLGSNPFLEVPDPSKAQEYKKGPVMRKCCVSADGKRTPYGKRGWRMFYAALRDTVLYLHKNVNTYGKFVSSSAGAGVQSGENAIRIHHCLAVRAQDYTKKQNVFRLFTADWAEYLFQCSDSKEMQGWIDTVNFVAASMSSPPLPSACGSRKKFQRPLMPSAPTKLSLLQQLQSHAVRVKEIEEELEALRKNPPPKRSKSSVVNDYNERNAFYQFELRRFKTYQYLLEARMVAAGTPSLVEESIAEEASEMASPELAPKTPNVSDNDAASNYSGSTAEASSPSKIAEASLSSSKLQHNVSPKNAKKKSAVGNPKLKQLSPNKATDRYSYRAAIYGENTETGFGL